MGVRRDADAEDAVVQPAAITDLGTVLGHRVAA
jgi:hypothetical protein